MQPPRTIEIVNATRGTIVGSAIEVAATARSRLVGLLGRADLNPGEGLLIVPSSGVHTWGMRFPIDVVALDRHLRVLDVWEHLGSFRIAAVGWTTRSVLELPAGTVRRSQIEVDDHLAITPATVGRTVSGTGQASGRPRCPEDTPEGRNVARAIDRIGAESRRRMTTVAYLMEQIVDLRTAVIPHREGARSTALRLAAALLCLIVSCHYAFIVLPPAAALKSSGIVADLYPGWYASRVVLLHHGDPYSPEVTARIQAAVYQGRLVSENEQRFAYPIFAILLFAPFAVLPFGAAQICYFVVATLLTVLSVLAWLGRSVSPMNRIISVILVLSALPVMLGLELRQPTMLVAALLAGMVACLRAGRLVAAGVLGAVASAKPQLAIGILLPVFFWSIANWPIRKPLLVTLWLTLGSLLGVSEFVSHGWLLRWLATLGAYARYAGAKPLVCVLPGTYLPVLAGALLLGASIAVSWKWRAADLLLAIGFSVSVFQFVLPFQFYNEVMLLPGVLWALVQGPKPTRVLQILLHRMVWALLGAGWLITMVVCIAQVASPPSIMRLWSSPLVIAWLFPFGLLAHLAACAGAPAPTSVILNRTSCMDIPTSEALGA